MYPQNNYSYYQQAASMTAPQTNQMRYQPSLNLKGRPVSSIEEAKAMSIDFDGSIFYFPDLANRRIYTKQINMDGTASLNMYELKEIPSIETSSLNADYITRQEFEEAINILKNSLVNENMRPPVPEIVETAKPQEFKF